MGQGRAEKKEQKPTETYTERGRGVTRKKKSNYAAISHGYDTQCLVLALTAALFPRAGAKGLRRSHYKRLVAELPPNNDTDERDAVLAQLDAFVAVRPSAEGCFEMRQPIV